MDKSLRNITVRKLILPAFSIIETIISAIIISIIITTTTVILSNSFNIGKERLKLNQMIKISNQRVSFYKNTTQLINYEFSENIYNYHERAINKSINEIIINADDKQLNKVFLIKKIVNDN